MPERVDRPSQPPEKSLPLGPASAGRLSGQGWKRACGGPPCGCGEGVLTSSQAPWRSRIVNARHSPCRMKPPVADRCPCPGGKTRHATACRMRTPSGDIRARARIAPPRMSPAKAATCTLPTFRMAQPARGPPDFQLQNSGVEARGAFRLALEHPAFRRFRLNADKMLWIQSLRASFVRPSGRTAL